MQLPHHFLQNRNYMAPKLVLLLAAAALIALWYATRRDHVEISDHLTFEFDPRERFGLDKTYSWLATGIVVLAASVLLAT